MTSFLQDKSIPEIVRMIHAKQLSPVEVIRGFLRIIERQEPSIQAFETVTEEHALEHAKQLEQKIMDGGEAGPLAGIPYAAKDILYTAGIPTTASSGALQDFVPEFDATAITRLRAAGAVLLGKSTTAEFACSRVTHTRNPWNTQRSPGGSSAGSGAAVGAGMTVFALGSQTGGSLLRPSAYCGLVGMKPTFGRVSRYGVIPVSWTLDHIGPMTRTVEEQALALSVMSGYDSGDPDSLNVGRISPNVKKLNDLKGIKLGVPRTFFFDDLEEEVKVSVEKAIEQLRVGGAEIFEVELPSLFEAARSAHPVIMRTEASAYHAQRFKSRYLDYGEPLQASLAAGRIIPPALYLKAKRIRTLYIEAMREMMGQVDALVLPTAPGVAPFGESTGDSRLNSPFSMAGFPSLTVPCAIGVNSGMPIGLQLAGLPLTEERLLSFGAYCEEIFDIRKEWMSGVSA